jgi:hypothetical protein
MGVVRETLNTAPGISACYPVLSIASDANYGQDVFLCILARFVRFRRTTVAIKRLGSCVVFRIRYLAYPCLG